MKKLILFFLTLVFLYGDGIDEKIQMLVDHENYQRHHRLIDILFRERTSFYDNEEISSVKIVEILKENGLLKIFYKEPIEIRTTFITSIGSEVFIKAITDVLRELGYSYYLTAYMKKSSNKLKWSISYRSDHVIDPVLFARKLEGYNMYLTDISRVESEWIYNIASFGVTFADATKVSFPMEKYTILKPSGEYWVSLETAGKSVSIEKIAIGYWYPKVIFYDKDLKIVKLYKKDYSRKKAVLSIPKNAKFLKISDRYGVDSLKKGITVEIMEEN